MMEEFKQSRKHYDIAMRVVDTIANGEQQISKLALLKVLKPLLEDNISKNMLKENKIPDSWFIY
jgi:hypothetical protein